MGRENQVKTEPSTGKTLKERLFRFFLGSEVYELSLSLDRANVKGAKVVGRGTIVVDRKSIADSEEFVKLKDSAHSIVEYHNS